MVLMLILRKQNKMGGKTQRISMPTYPPSLAFAKCIHALQGNKHTNARVFNKSH